MKIRQKILGGFLIFALLVAVVASLAVSLSVQMEKLQDVELPMEQNLREVEISILEAIHAADAFRSTADPYYSQLYQEQLNDVKTSFPRYTALLDTAE